jgi:hypothetical protein
MSGKNTLLQDRRGFLASTLALLAGSSLSKSLGVVQSLAAPNREEMPLPRWEPGVLEIHHIATGRGNSTLVIGPDGTTLLIDAGEAHSAENLMSPARPGTSLRAGQWIARYVERQIDRIDQSGLDMMLLTHLHGDHVGEVAATSPQSARGSYKLTGAADVVEALQVREIVDRGWPDYRYPSPPRDATSLNYIAMAKAQAALGTRVQQARAGSLSQLALRRNPALYPLFSARILAVNGNVWTGEGETSKSLFPSLEGLAGEALPNENMCCVALRIGYGKFSYYTGGDLTCDTVYGQYPWHDIETPVAELAGAVSVAQADHHGYFDACGPAAVRALHPRVWIIPTWHASHPALGVLANLFSRDLYAGDRSVFALDMAPAALLTTERFSSGLACSDGHVVIRVPPGGSTFSVFAVNSSDESGTVVASFVPYTT